ncbi:MAG: tRNA dihydrouridine synthase DusB [Melioribacteraceae bacterium]|nr:tRNA dihydrouridine synthase DusB [Melioribacteraceae bacterium]MCF8264548.1 tRNA dihydrouridine synthase DusB [Melioribacteraceae bacterium]MCF8413742.1 tRNA dihydrouridine synthase DusB [Melioribacteraceae bacterium]MCF8432584.1 tRNA dihydrouridine synthase DusB [Melioribacteraceae bacterium]
MLKIREINIDKALLLAPMEDVTGIAFRRICKELGADIVFTEFVNSDGLIRDNEKTKKKMEITENERPVGIQIYGGNLEPMIEAARISERMNPDIIDINAGCWVKKIAKRGAGAGLLKDPEFMEKMVSEIVKVVEKPVTVKTRIGWDSNSIMIEEIAQRVEDAGAEALTIHCRTREMGHKGDPQWEWIAKVKEKITIPVILNGGLFTPEDVRDAFEQTGADGVMIARGAIGNPWLFREAKEILEKGSVLSPVSIEDRIKTTLLHLKYEIEEKGERRGTIPFRKYYSGYLKGLHNASGVRSQLMQFVEYEPIEELLLEYLTYLQNYEPIAI